MKILTLMRHGKAADPELYDDDFERPLVKRGKAEAEYAISALRLSKLSPSLIMCSPANRTASTARIAAAVLDYPEEQIFYFAPLYNGANSHYLDAFLRAEAPHILIIGHNPTIAQLANHFSQDMLLSFPTSGMISFAFENEDLQDLETLLNARPDELFRLLRD